MANALAGETSPYLLQHKDNPVNWHPWGEAAFEEARRRDVMVFLSAGYSTCHWCHVMAHESFEDEATAAVMNENFVCVKVDREERPDVDAAYMEFVQATTGQGGWPMSVWLTPLGEAVFGGTYFPPEDRGGRVGFRHLCRELGRLWRTDRARMEEAAADIAHKLRGAGRGQATPGGDFPGREVFRAFFEQARAGFDSEWGGWGGAPKFPRPAVPRLLLQGAEQDGGTTGEKSRGMVRKTLECMAAGGIHDQLGGGFHRYSVDRWWHVPHYEKMLYDQAQMLELYLDGWQLDGDERWSRVARGIARYVVGEMHDTRGGFHAAEDADSVDADGKLREGAYWTWRTEEVREILGAADAELACAAWGMEKAGNARPESDPHGELQGRNTLYQALDPAALRERFGKEAEERLERIRSVLREVRGTRPRPHRDDKVVTAWNGLMIGALARAAQLPGGDAFLKAAQEAAGFLRAELWKNGKLDRSWRGRSSGVAGFPTDYASLIHGLIRLHAVDSKGWLEWAVELQAAMDREYWHGASGGYPLRTKLGERELAVIREDYDGAEPAPGHLAATNLLELEALTGEAAYGERAEALLRAGDRVLRERPWSAPVLLAALDLRLRGVQKFSVGREARRAFEFYHSYHPRAVAEMADGSEITLCEGTTCRMW